MAELVWDIASSLRTEGYRAFEPYERFLESFGTAAEIKTHQICVIEVAKKKLSRPRPMSLSADEKRELYSSPFLKTLEKELELANGCDASQLEKLYGGAECIWRRITDPCERKMVRFEIEENAEYRTRWKAFSEEQAVAIEEEVTRFGLFDDYPLEAGDRLSTYVAMMGAEAQRLGFKEDQHKSRLEYPVFSKSICSQWDLCFVIQNVDMFALPEKLGFLAFGLELRRADVRGSSNRWKAGDFLTLGFQQMLPGFANAYWGFKNRAELELHIKAHIAFYKEVASIIEGSIRNALD